MKKYEYVEIQYKIDYLPYNDLYLPYNDIRFDLTDFKLRTTKDPVSKKRIHQQIMQDRRLLTEPVCFFGHTWHTLSFSIRKMKEFRKLFFEVLPIIENANNAFVAVQKHTNTILILVPISESFIDCLPE